MNLLSRVILIVLLLATTAESALSTLPANSWLNCGTPASLRVDTPITVGIKFKYIAGSQDFDTLIYFGDLSSIDRWKIQLDSANAWLKVFADINDAGLSITGNDDVTTGSINTVVVTIDATAGTVMYINGVSDASSTAAGAKLGFDDLPSGSTFTLGNGCNNVGTCPENTPAERGWDGTIYEAFVSNSIWTTQQILTWTNMNTHRFPLQDSSILEYWVFDDYDDGNVLTTSENFTGMVNQIVCTSTASPEGEVNRELSY